MRSLILVLLEAILIGCLAGFVSWLALSKLVDARLSAENWRLSYEAARSELEAFSRTHGHVDPAFRCERRSL